MRVQRFRSKFDVVIDLPQLRAATVECVHQLPRRHVDHAGELVVRKFCEIAQQDHGARVEGEGGQRPLHRVAPQRPARFGLREVLQADLGGTLPPTPTAREPRRTDELGRGSKHVGPLDSFVVRAVAQAIGNLAKRRARDGGSAIDVIDETGHVVQNEGEVRIELAFYGRRPSTYGWRFNVYLIHYWDGERMAAV